MSKTYFISYNLRNENNSTGFGNTSLNVGKETTLTLKDIREMEKHIAKNINAEQVIILYFTEIVEDEPQS